MDAKDIIEECKKVFKVIPEEVLFDEVIPKEKGQETIDLWLSFLSSGLREAVKSALEEGSPFLSNDLSVDNFLKMNDHFEMYNELTFLYTILIYALEWKLYRIASAIVFVTDRPSYRYGNSHQLMKIVKKILQSNPDAHIAPQVILRKARLMKDIGDLHGAMQTLNGVLDKEFKWNYRNKDQILNVEAVCVQIKGQIYHNLGLWREGIISLVDSVKYFKSLNDLKGMSYSYGLLTKCLTKLTVNEFLSLKSDFSDFFTFDNPCYQGYRLSIDNVDFVSKMSGSDNLFTAKHQLTGDECLLMYADQRISETEKYNLHQTVIADIKKCIELHRDGKFLKSSEHFYEFVKALFVISVTLSFSRLQQDQCLSKYLEQLCIELYKHLCLFSQDRRIDHNQDSLKFINGALKILGLSEIQDIEADLEKEIISNSKKTPAFEKNKEVAKVKSATVEDIRESCTVDTDDRNVSASVPSPGKYGGNFCPIKFSRKFVGLHAEPKLFYTSEATDDSSKDESSGISSKETGDCSDELVDISWASVSGNFGGDSYRLTDLERVGAEVKQAASEPTAQDNKSSVGSERSQSSSTSANSSSVFSASTVDNFSCETTETEDSSTDDGNLNPLVNINSQDIFDRFTELNLGESSSSTSSSLDYLLNWKLPSIQPTKDSEKMSRAHLLTYNPVTCLWNLQSTLAYIGTKYDLGENSGKFRDVYDIKYLHQDEPLGRYVCKRYRNQREPKCYMQDVICQMVAGYYVNKFNEALTNYKTAFSVQFLPVAHLQLLDEEGVLRDWVNVEPFLHGEFNKLSNNWMFVTNKALSQEPKDLAIALSHFSYTQSKGTLMIVDIQGWLPTDNSGIIYLTDPQFHTSASVKKFNTFDQKQEGIDNFWKHVHKSCNKICHLLNLQRP